MGLKAKAEERVPHADPLERPDYTEADIQAVRAVFNGVANEDQQRRALDWIVEFAAATHDTSFRPENQNLTAFAEGKRFVGQTIIWAIRQAPTKTDPDKIATRSAGDPDARPDNDPG